MPACPSAGGSADSAFGCSGGSLPTAFGQRAADEGGVEPTREKPIVQFGATGDVVPGVGLAIRSSSPLFFGSLAQTTAQEIDRAVLTGGQLDGHHCARDRTVPLGLAVGSGAI